jgi:hypothetical protein
MAASYHLMMNVKSMYFVSDTQSVFSVLKHCNMGVEKLQIPALFLRNFKGSCPLCGSLMSDLKVLLSLCVSDDWNM